MYISTLNKKILLNSINYTSLGSFFHLKEEAVFDSHEVTIFPEQKCISCNKEPMCIWVHIFILKMVYMLP